MKHAYLILVHKETYTLRKLLELLDDDRNDIYIHVDAKTDISIFSNYNLRKAKLFFVNRRHSIIWGGLSMVEAEFELLKESISKGKYAYYHLLSGSDLPLKTQDFIHNFLDKSDGIYIDSTLVDPRKGKLWKSIYRRLEVKRFFVKYKNKDGIVAKIYSNLDRLLILFQEKILKRNFIKKQNINLFYGSQWFSIPHDVVEYVLNNEKKIMRIFNNSYIPDELFLQTFVEMGNFGDRVKNDNLRYIVFDRNIDNKHPRTWTSKDYNVLMNSNYFFARKFDEKVDKYIIDKICDKIS